MKEFFLLFVGFYLMLQHANSQPGNTVAGGNGQGSAADQLSGAQDIFVDAAGNIYIADANNNRIQKWVPGSREGITVAGGNGAGPALNQLNYPDAVFVDTAGNIYVHEQNNYRILKFAPGALEGVKLVSVFGKEVFVDPAGSIYYFDQNDYSIKKFNQLTSEVVIVAGGHGRGPASNQVGYAAHIFVDANSNVYVADGLNKRIHKWVPGASAGVTVASVTGPTGEPDSYNGSLSVFVDTNNNIYVAEGGNYRITKWAPGAAQGVTVAGDRGRGAGANQLDNPSDVTVDASGNLYIADAGNDRIQKVMPRISVSLPPPSGITVAGGMFGSDAEKLSVPNDVFVDDNFNIYVADVGNYRVQKFAPGSLTGVTVAGGNGYGSAANQLANPLGICVDKGGNVYVADFFNHRIQKWAPDATSGVTVAGGNGFGSAANQTPQPLDVYVDHAGNVYVSDNVNARVQKWAPGAVTGVTVAGGNGPGPAANQVYPGSIFVDDAGNLYVCDASYYRVQKWAPGASSGITVAGGNGYGTTANQANPNGIVVDAAQNVYISELIYNRVMKWAPGATTGVVVAGGNDQAGSDANQLNRPEGIYLDADHNLYVADKYNMRVQKFQADYGLSYKYYEGDWTELPDFTVLTPVKKGNSLNADISTRTPERNDHFAFLWEGNINIPTAGTYTFETFSDDGSNFYFNSRYLPSAVPTVNNTGLHTSKSATGTINIPAPGIYPVAITFFESGGDEAMELYWSGPGIPRQRIPNAAFTSTSGEDNSAPGKPANLYVVSKGGNFITIDWDDAIDNVGVTAYDIYVGGVKRFSSSTSQVTADNLLPNTSYSFKLVARDLEGNTSDYSNPISETTGTSINGLTYKYYEGDWNVLPDFSTLSPLKTGASLNIDISVRNPGTNDHFAFVWDGFINITTPGTYTFETVSDDGSKLYFNTPYNPSGTATVDNDGLHAPLSAKGLVNIPSAGVYPISITFYEKDGGEQMQVYWTGPGIPRQLIPDVAFLQTPPPQQKGLIYKYYEGDWNLLPDFNALTPVKTGTSENINIGVRPPEKNDHFGFVWEGYINIPTAGNYTFESISDDGSKFYFNTLYNPSALATVSNDGLHAPSSATGAVMIPSAGSYPVSITYFEKDGGEVMQMYWTGPGIACQLIPDSVFTQAPLTRVNTFDMKARNPSAAFLKASVQGKAIINSVYPNPFSQSFNIDFYNSSASNHVYLSIYDLKGNMVYQRHDATIPKGQTVLQVNPGAHLLTNGTYFVQLKINGVVLKIVKLIKVK